MMPKPEPTIAVQARLPVKEHADLVREAGKRGITQYIRAALVEKIAKEKKKR